jgi:hypothetical protein
VILQEFREMGTTKMISGMERLEIIAIGIYNFEEDEDYTSFNEVVKRGY